MLRTALFGAYAGGVEALITLASNSQVVLVVAPEHRSGDQVAAVAANRGVPVLRGPFAKSPEFRAQLRSLGVQIAINVLSPFVMCSEVFTAPLIGAFNLHPSLLPRFGGRNPTAWAIYRGEKQHGATLHWIAAEIDKGDIALQKSLAIREDHTPVSLLRDTMRAGMGLIEELLQTAADSPGTIPRFAQDPTIGEYFGGQAPAGGWLAWNRPAREIVRLARAFDYGPIQSPWGPLKAIVDGREVSIARASLTGIPCANVRPGARNGNRIASEDEWVNVCETERSAA